MHEQNGRRKAVPILSGEQAFHQFMPARHSFQVCEQVLHESVPVVQDNEWLVHADLFDAYAKNQDSVSAAGDMAGGMTGNSFRPAA